MNKNYGYVEVLTKADYLRAEEAGYELEQLHEGEWVPSGFWCECHPKRATLPEPAASPRTPTMSNRNPAEEHAAFVRGVATGYLNADKGVNLEAIHALVRQWRSEAAACSHPDSAHSETGQAKQECADELADALAASPAPASGLTTYEKRDEDSPDCPSWVSSIPEAFEAGWLARQMHEEGSRLAAAPGGGDDAVELAHWRNLHAAFLRSGMPEAFPSDGPRLWPNPDWPQDVALIAFVLYRAKPTASAGEEVYAKCNPDWCAYCGRAPIAAECECSCHKETVNG